MKKTIFGVEYTKVSDGTFGNTEHVGVSFRAPNGNYYAGWIPKQLWDSVPIQTTLGKLVDSQSFESVMEGFRQLPSHDRAIVRCAAHRALAGRSRGMGISTSDTNHEIHSLYRHWGSFSAIIEDEERARQSEY